MCCECLACSEMEAVVIETLCWGMCAETAGQTERRALVVAQRGTNRAAASLEGGAEYGTETLVDFLCVRRHLFALAAQFCHRLTAVPNFNAKQPAMRS